MEKDRDKRYATAAEMKADLQHLKKETESGLTRTGGRETSPVRAAHQYLPDVRANARSYLLTRGHGFAGHGAGGGWDLVHQTSRRKYRRRAKNAIAVLPLQNLNGDFSVDYLRFALADEIANTLTYSRTLDVRPSAVTRKYVSADLDPSKWAASFMWAPS